MKRFYKFVGFLFFAFAGMTASALNIEVASGYAERRQIGEFEVLFVKSNSTLRISGKSGVIDVLAVGGGGGATCFGGGGGAGVLKTYFYSFTDTPNARAKHGYDRKFNSNRPGETFSLVPEWKSYSASFIVPANETLGLAFIGDDANDVFIDDVFVTMENDR